MFLECYRVLQEVLVEGSRRYFSLFKRRYRGLQGSHGSFIGFQERYRGSEGVLDNYQWVSAVLRPRVRGFRGATETLWGLLKR